MCTRCSPTTNPPAPPRLHFPRRIQRLRHQPIETSVSSQRPCDLCLTTLTAPIADPGGLPASTPSIGRRVESKWQAPSTAVSIRHPQRDHYLACVFTEREIL
jgi:hypothetical protein